MTRSFQAAMAALLVVCATGCGESGTGGEQVQFRLGFESLPAAGEASPGHFTTATGWSVQLEEARIALGPLYLFTRAAPTASLLPRLRDWFVPVAHAHSGFDDYDGGEVRGELLDPVVVDGLASGLQAEVELVGIAGPIRSSTVELVDVSDPSLHGGQAWIRGTARKGDEEVRFAGALLLPADTKSRRIVGIPAEVDLARETEVIFELHLDRWLADAEFDALPPAGADEIRPIVRESQVHSAWYLGARGYGSITIR